MDTQTIKRHSRSLWPLVQVQPAHWELLLEFCLAAQVEKSINESLAALAFRPDHEYAVAVHVRPN